MAASPSDSPPPSEQTEPPRLLRMLAALTFAFFLFNTVAYLKLLGEGHAPGGPRWFPVPFVLSLLTSLAGLLFVWLERRVGLLVLAVGATALNGVCLAAHAWNPIQLLLPALVSLVGFSQVRKLR